MQPIRISDLRKVDPLKACQYFNNCFKDPSTFTVVIVGNIDPAIAGPLILQYLVSLSLNLARPRGIRYSILTGFVSPCRVEYQNLLSRFCISIVMISGVYLSLFLQLWLGNLHWLFFIYVSAEPQFQNSAMDETAKGNSWVNAVRLIKPVLTLSLCTQIPLLETKCPSDVLNVLAEKLFVAQWWKHNVQSSYVFLWSWRTKPWCGTLLIHLLKALNSYDWSSTHLLWLLLTDISLCVPIHILPYGKKMNVDARDSLCWIFKQTFGNKNNASSTFQAWAGEFVCVLVYFHFLRPLFSINLTFI